MPSDTVMMTIRLPRDLRDAFLEAARRDDLSASQILRRAIRDYLSEGESLSRSARPAPVPTPAPVFPVADNAGAEPEGDEDDLADLIQGVAKMCGIEKWG